MAINARLAKVTLDKGTEQYPAKTSLTIENGVLVKFTPGTGADVAGAWDSIVWVSLTEGTNVSDVLVIPTDDLDTVILSIDPVTSGDVDESNINQYFDLTVDGLEQKVLGNTASATTGQVRLLRVLNDGAEGEFKIVNA